MALLGGMKDEGRKWTNHRWDEPW